MTFSLALVAKFPKTDILYVPFPLSTSSHPLGQSRLHPAFRRLTHGPPSGIFDQTRGEDLAGCEALRARLPSLRPRIHLFGHIHEARGAFVHQWVGDGASEPPVVQNDNNLSDDYDEAGSYEEAEAGSIEGEADAADDDAEARKVATAGDAETEETVFVNAATFPAGRGAWRGTHRVPFGGPGFQAVVVDLRD